MFLEESDGTSSDCPSEQAHLVPKSTQPKSASKKSSKKPTASVDSTDTTPELHVEDVDSNVSQQLQLSLGSIAYGRLNSNSSAPHGGALDTQPKGDEVPSKVCALL